MRRRTPTVGLDESQVHEIVRGHDLLLNIKDIRKGHG